MNDPLPARLAGISKSYGSTAALDALDLDVRPGETLALLGPNGAGKTTALRVLLGLIKPDAGTATLFGADPRRYQSRRRAGAMLQTGGVPPTATVRELIELFSTYYPQPLAVAESLERAGVAAIANRRFGDLSGGQQQRTLFALAICGNPHLLVLDEPTNNLDIEARRLLWQAIKTFVAGGRSVLIATHDLTEAERLGDRVAVLRAGRIVDDGSVSELIARSAAPTFEGAVLALAGLAPELEEVA